MNDATLCHVIKHWPHFFGGGGHGHLPRPLPISLQPQINFQCAHKTVHHMSCLVAASAWSLLQPRCQVRLLNYFQQRWQRHSIVILWSKKIQVLTSLTKLREYVALLYATSNCLCLKSDEVIAAMYFQWRPVNYSLAKNWYLSRVSYSSSVGSCVMYVCFISQDAKVTVFWHAMMPDHSVSASMPKFCISMWFSGVKNAD